MLIEKSAKRRGESAILKEIENELASDFGALDKSLNDSTEKDLLGGKRTSYYVEENERLLNLLITNCEPILSETVSQINHFNTYNKIQKVVEKSGFVLEDYSIASDCTLQGPLLNA